MGAMTSKNSRSGKLVLLLAALAVLAGSQPQSCKVVHTDEYIEQLRETVIGLDLDQVRQTAGQGDASAQTSLGLMYFHGEGVLEDMREAAKWFREAAKQGVAPAQYTLGHMYAYGKGVPEDGWEATKWFRLAAEQGHVTAQFLLGFAYRVGGYGASSAGGPSKDSTEAVKWMRMAAERGNTDAQLHLGLMYFEGEEVAKDSTEGVRWWRMAAEQGNETAQMLLYTIYFDGNLGIPKDYTEAAKWLLLAYAEQGLAEALLSLGQAYEEDPEEEEVGLGKDYVKAYAWYILAAAKDSEEASELKDSLGEKMTSAQLTEAHELAAELREHIEAAKPE